MNKSLTGLNDTVNGDIISIFGWTIPLIYPLNFTDANAKLIKSLVRLVLRKAAFFLFFFQIQFGLIFCM